MPKTRANTSTFRILSAGAPKMGVRLCAEAYSNMTGNPFFIEFATAPKLRDLVSLGAQSWDVVVAPIHIIRAYVADDTLVAGSVVALGSVSVGVAVKNGAHDPDLSSIEKFRNALEVSDKLIFNTATSGEYMEDVIRQMGLTEALAKKLVRPSTGAAVLRYLASERSAYALGFGQTTEIKLHEELGIHLVGPLPGKLGKKILYAAGRLHAAENTDSAEGLLAFFASVTGKKILARTGLELSYQL